eukprot:6204789-Pleurochrysis_carterae.AAC.1
MPCNISTCEAAEAGSAPEFEHGRRRRHVEDDVACLARRLIGAAVEPCKLHLPVLHRELAPHLPRDRGVNY